MAMEKNIPKDKNTSAEGRPWYANPMLVATWAGVCIAAFIGICIGIKVLSSRDASTPVAVAKEKAEATSRPVTAETGNGGRSAAAGDGGAAWGVLRKGERPDVANERVVQCDWEKMFGLTRKLPYQLIAPDARGNARAVRYCGLNRYQTNDYGCMLAKVGVKLPAAEPAPILVGRENVDVVYRQIIAQTEAEALPLDVFDPYMSAIGKVVSSGGIYAKAPEPASCVLLLLGLAGLSLRRRA